MSTQEMSYAEAIREALTLEMRRDADVFLMGEDVGIYGGAFGISEDLIEEFGGDRVLDTPISEAAFTGIAIGAAMAGMRPVVEIMFSDFMAVCWDMLVNQAAKMHYMYGGQFQVPMVVRTASGAGTGAGAQHSQSLEAALCHVPGLKVVAPGTPDDAKGLLTAAIRDNNPVIFLEQKLLYPVHGQVKRGEHVIPLGKSQIKREGRDCTIVTYGRMVQESLHAAEILEQEEGVFAEVLDLRTLAPLDRKSIQYSVGKTGRLVIVHEAVGTAGLGGEIAATVMENDVLYRLKAPIKRVTGMDVPIPFSPTLEQAALPSAARIVHAVQTMMRDNPL